MNRQAVMSFESPLAGRLVKFAPDPSNDVAVTTPVAFTPVAVAIPDTFTFPVISTVFPRLEFIVTLLEAPA